jgi:SSS family solute:Na+ symporter
VTSNLLPGGIRGIVIASLLAALISSLASCFNSSSTLFTMDFYKRFRTEASEKELVLVGRLATTVLVVLGILWVPFIRFISSQVYIYLQSVQAYISPPIAAVFIFGILWKRVNGKGAVWALLSGAVVGVIRLVLELLNKSGNLSVSFLQTVARINFLHFAIFLFIISSGVLVGVSLLTQAPTKQKIAGLTFASASQVENEFTRSMEAGNPVWKRANIGFSMILVALVIFLYIKFF